MAAPIKDLHPKLDDFLLQQMMCTLAFGLVTAVGHVFSTIIQGCGSCALGFVAGETISYFLEKELTPDLGIDPTAIKVAKYVIPILTTQLTTFAFFGFEPLSMTLITIIQLIIVHSHQDAASKNYRDYDSILVCEG